MEGGTRVYNIVLVFSSGASVSKKLLKDIYMLGSKGYRLFNIYVVSPRGRPEYIEFLRDFIQNNIVYSINIYYIGSRPIDLDRFVDNKSLSNISYYIEHGMHDFIEVLRKHSVDEYNIIEG